MRSLLTGLLALLATGLISAQPSLERPRTSPGASVAQKVGVSEIVVKYHRPGVKGRQIWGALVPYDQPWRTGANEVSTISFTDGVSIEGKPLAAGTYGLFTIPRAASWTVIFSSNTETWGTDYDSSKDVLKVEVTPRPSEMTEWMLFSFSGISDTGATLELRWEKLAVPVRIGVPTVDIVLNNARKEFSAGADTGRWQMLRQAAGYAVAQNVHLDEALIWIDRSIAVKSTLQSLCIKSDILALTGDVAGAATALDQAVAAGKESDAASYALTLRRDNRPGRAVEMLERFAAKNGGSWTVSRELGESFDAAGDHAKALDHLNAAAEKAPGDAEKKEIADLIKTINERK